MHHNPITNFFSPEGLSDTWAALFLSLVIISKRRIKEAGEGTAAYSCQSESESRNALVL